jgi:hypothetical protein
MGVPSSCVQVEASDALFVGELLAQVKKNGRKSRTVTARTGVIDPALNARCVGHAGGSRKKSAID